MCENTCMKCFVRDLLSRIQASKPINFLLTNFQVMFVFLITIFMLFYDLMFSEYGDVHTIYYIYIRIKCFVYLYVIKEI